MKLDEILARLRGLWERESNDADADVLLAAMNMVARLGELADDRLAQLRTIARPAGDTAWALALAPDTLVVRLTDAEAAIAMLREVSR